MTRYARAAGLRLASLGESWVVYCARSGDTVQLNNEAAVVLELLGDEILDEPAVAARVAEAAGVDVDPLVEQMAELLPQLEALGFVDERG